MTRLSSSLLDTLPLLIFCICIGYCAVDGERIQLSANPRYKGPGRPRSGPAESRSAAEEHGEAAQADAESLPGVPAEPRVQSTCEGLHSSVRRRRRCQRPRQGRHRGEGKVVTKKIARIICYRVLKLRNYNLTFIFSHEGCNTVLSYISEYFHVFLPLQHNAIYSNR